MRELESALAYECRQLADALDADQRDRLKREYFDHREKIRVDVEAMLGKIQADLLLQPTLTPLFTVRWEVVRVGG